MEPWVEELIACARRFTETMQMAADVWSKVCSDAYDVIHNIFGSPKYELLFDILYARFTGDIIEKGAYIGDDALSPRQYGERLSWGKRGRPYRLYAYSYIATFKRNLPYQRRPQ